MSWTARGLQSSSQAQKSGAAKRRSTVSPADLLDVAGPSVVSINGVVASLAVTEFMLRVTGIREPNRLLTYHGRTGKVTVSTDEPVPDCYYCKGLWGTGDRADVQRYIREGVGAFLR